MDLLNERNGAITNLERLPRDSGGKARYSAIKGDEN